LSEPAVGNGSGGLFFERIRNKLEHQYETALASAPYMHGSMVADLLLEASNRGSIHQRLAYLTNRELLTRRDLLHFSNKLLSCFHLEMLVHGNVLPSVAKEWSDIILDTFKPASVARLLPMRGVQLPAVASSHNECIYRLQGWNEHDENNCIVNVYQVGLVDIPTNAKLSLLLQLLREPAFNVLRTEEQLGYIVFTSLKTTANNVKNLMFLIQSDSFDPIHVDTRIENFLTVFRTKIMVEMTEEAFQDNVDSFCESILEKDKNLGEESSKHWNVINNQTYQFRRLHQIAQEARRLTKVDVLRFFDRFVLAKSPYRRKLSIQMFGKGSEPKRIELLKTEPTGGENEPFLIKCPDEFVRTQCLFPAQPIGSIQDLVFPLA
jgi:insulysin